MKTVEITEDKFKAFERVRKSGLTNMFDAKRVEQLAKEVYKTRLKKDEIQTIWRHYSPLKEQFKKERDERLKALNHE